MLWLAVERGWLAMGVFFAQTDLQNAFLTFKGAPFLGTFANMTLNIWSTTK